MTKPPARSFADLANVHGAVRTGLLLAATLLVGSEPPRPAAAQSPADRFFGNPVAAQPFDRVPFRPVSIPGWVEETLGCGYTLSGMDFEHRKRAAEHGVTISELGFVDPFYPYYDSKLLKKRSPHVPLGRLEKDIAEYKKLGIRILGVYPPCLQGEVYETRPDWRRIATNTTEIPLIDMKKHPYGGMLCLLGPYGDFFIDVLCEIAERFPDVDAFSFDGLHYGGVCYCANCRTEFRKQTGREIPNADLNDPAFRRYQHWADRRMEDLVRRMQTRLKTIKPAIALVTWTTNAGRFGHFLSIPRNMPTRMNLLLDAPDQEFWLDETNRGATVVPALANAYIWATTNHRVAFSEPYLMSHGNPYGKDAFPAHEVLRRMLLAVTYGVQPSIAVAQPDRLQRAIYDCLDEVQSRKPWLVHKKPEYWAGILLSDNTRNFYGRSPGKVEERYLASVFGAFRACLESHLPVNLINDWNLDRDDLSKYSVILLPNAACLDENQVAALEEYVRNGGGLVASLDTSLFNEFGDPRPGFALANVMGVKYAGAAENPEKPAPAPAPAPAPEALDINFAKAIGPDYWEKRKGVFDLRRGKIPMLYGEQVKALVGDEPVTFKGAAVRVQTVDDKAFVLATFTPKDRPDAPAIPAVVAREYGKGRAVYFAVGIDSAYYLYPYPYQRAMTAREIVWAAKTKPPVVVKAPMCVHSTLMRQSIAGASRLVLHLYNDVNTSAFHALPNDDVPLREETLPIHDIEVEFDKRYAVKRVHLEPGGGDLPTTRRSGGGARVVVPRLDVHAMVVAELD